MRRLGLQQRSSVPSLHAALAAEASAALGMLSSGRLAQEVHADPPAGGEEASVRASCPTKPLCAPLLHFMCSCHSFRFGTKALLSKVIQRRNRPYPAVLLQNTPPGNTTAGLHEIEGSRMR